MMLRERWTWRLWTMRRVLVGGAGGGHGCCVHESCQCVRGHLLGYEELQFLVVTILCCRRHHRDR